MSDKIGVLEREIQKIEAQVRSFKKQKPGSERDAKIHEATFTLLRNVLNDLRKQQRHLLQSEKGEVRGGFER